MRVDVRELLGGVGEGGGMSSRSFRRRASVLAVRLTGSAAYRGRSRRAKCASVSANG